MSKIYFIVGIKHCGKSTVGLQLSKEMNIPYFDLDTLIEEATGYPVREFYIKYGRDEFLNEEFKALKNLLTSGSNYICATGGGICENSRAYELLKSLSNIIFINTPPETLYSRIIRNGVPAFLKSEDPETEFYELYERRSLLYKKIAKIEINGSNKSPNDIVDEILTYTKEQ
ncbi:MAG: shikimate kinase [Spirochaetales bacterium]|nr:shikimate kinase [Spirochaetales bacterium]